MKKQHNLLIIMLFAFIGLSFVSCKKEQITLSAYELWFPGDVGSVQNINIKANCGWTISIDDDADWYTIRGCKDTTVYTQSGGVMTYSIADMTQIVTDGYGDLTIAITVDPLTERSGRSSSFTITSQKGKVSLKVRIDQETDMPVEITDIRNMVFGVSNVAHWNVDYFGEVIEDSYKYKEFDPYDTTTGYIMYFFDDGSGIQKDNTHDSVYYFPFTYVYDFSARNLHIEFETYADTLSEIYDAPVLLATEDVFRFLHEYKPKFWERADMKKIGDTHKPEAKRLRQYATKKRKGDGAIFQF